MTAPATAGASVRPGRRLRRAGTLVPTLDALLEGSLIAVIDAALAAFSGSTALGPFPFAIAAAASLFWVRHARDRTEAIVGLGALYASAFIGAGLLGGTFAQALSPDGRPILLAETAAFCGALAVFRGSRHVDPLDDDVIVGSLLQWGLPLLAVPWLYVSSLAGPARDAFTAAAFPATVLFAATGLLAVGLARLDSLAALSGVNWRSNRAWLVLLASVLGVMLAIALPTAFLLGTPLTLLAAGLMGPLGVVLTPFAAVFRTLVELIFLLLTPLIEFIRSLAAGRQPDQQTDGIGGAAPVIPPGTEQGEPSTLALIIAVSLAIAVGVALFLVLLRLTYRPRPEAETEREGPLEEREFRLPHLALHLPHLGRPHRRAASTTATGAYLAFLADLGSAPDLARQPDEPPATHVARIRRAGFADPRAALLAADYGLERYALRDLSPRETARALRRPARLRELLRQRPSAGPDGGTAGDRA